jgi:hypothetical protein
MYPENWFALSMLQFTMVYKIIEEGLEVLPTVCPINHSSSSSPQSQIIQPTEDDDKKVSNNISTKRSSYRATVTTTVSKQMKPWHTSVHLMVMFLMARPIQVSY